MKVQSINALSSNSNATKLKQEQYQTNPSFDGLNLNKSAKIMKALAASAILGMAAVNMSACKQPLDPTPVEMPWEKQINSENNENVLREIGFSHITSVEVPKEEGKYQPKKGEVVEISEASTYGSKWTYTLNRELSTDGCLIYDMRLADDIFDNDYGTKMMSFDPETKTLLYEQYAHETMLNYEEKGYNLPYKYIKVKEDGTFVKSGFSINPDTGGAVLIESETEIWFDNKEKYKDKNKKYNQKYKDSIWVKTDSDWIDEQYYPDGVKPLYTNIEFTLAK